MRTFPFRAYGAAIRDALRATADAKFGADKPKLIEHDDHWLRPSTFANIKDRKTPAVFVALNSGQTPSYGDQDDGQVESECAFDVIFLEVADRAGELKAMGTAAVEWIYEVFGIEDLNIPGYTPPEGVLLEYCVPVSFGNFVELLDLGLIGTRVTIEVSSAHADPDN